MTSADAVIDSLRNRPDDWKDGPHRLTHTPSGTEFWVCNGWFHLVEYDGFSKVVRFTLDEKWRVFREIKRWRDSSFANRFIPKNP